MGNTHLLEFNNVSFSYDDDKLHENFALKNVSFTVDEGEFIVILGHNGSGKSTLAKLANSIFVPSEGKVFVKGIDTADVKNEFEVRKTVGVVFQNPDNQIVASIVEEDVAFGPENLSVPPAEIRERVNEALKSVGMYEYRLHETHRLSGGQKQRVAIAGIIAMKPRCLVLDEPTAMLDPKGRAEVMETVKKLNSEFGITVMFITHFMEEAVLSDRVMVINDGGLIMDAPPEKVFSMREKLHECGLEVPDAAELAFRLRKNGISIPENILSEADLIDAIRAQLKLSGGKNAGN